MYDAARKSLQLAKRLAVLVHSSGWRKAQYLIKRFKSHSRQVGKLFYSKSKDKHQRLQKATEAYLEIARKLSRKLDVSEPEFAASSACPEKQRALLEQLKYFKGHLDSQIDLVHRRIIDGVSIPHSEKVFSLFEPYTEWIQRGKAGKKQELGLKLAIAVDQFSFILSRNLMQNQLDKDVAVPIAKELLRKYDVGSVSYDKAFWTPENYETLSRLVQNLVLPKKGRPNPQQYERQHSKTFLALRKQHSAVESAINCLEHHGLNRCPDRGLSNFKKYSALGVLACNLHTLGKLLKQKETKLTKNRKAA